jgi:HD-like signal output (HDOD) protein|tara:strand:+ start:178 stop:405 length:228 start_codon:yes stop_codon:yes gene_type:complete
MCWEWKLPESLASAIGGHNQLEENGQYEQLAAVFLVSFIRNSKDNPGAEQLMQMAQEKYGLEPQMVKALLEESFE